MIRERDGAENKNKAKIRKKTDSGVLFQIAGGGTLNRGDILAEIKLK